MTADPSILADRFYGGPCKRLLHEFHKYIRSKHTVEDDPGVTPAEAKFFLRAQDLPQSVDCRGFPIPRKKYHGEYDDTRREMQTFLQVPGMFGGYKITLEVDTDMIQPTLHIVIVASSRQGVVQAMWVRLRFTKDGFVKNEERTRRSRSYY